MTARSCLPLLVLAAALAFATGCASPAKLARRSQEQLAAGEPSQAYETALKAVRKDPYNEAAQAALREAGGALLASDARRMRSLAATGDTLAAAEAALGLEALRRQTAEFGVTLTGDAALSRDEWTVRRGAARAVAGAGDDRYDAGELKEACAEYERAQELDPDDESLADQLALTRAQATDRLLLLPYAFDVRAPLDTRALSWTMYRNVERYATERFAFTQLLAPGDAWDRLSRRADGDTRAAAYGAGEEMEATRVAWARVHGDRFETHVMSFDDVLYREITERTIDGIARTRWIEVPVHVRIEDLWASVAVECEVHALAGTRVVARRTAERSAGTRTVWVVGDLPGTADQYALHTPAMWEADREGCERRTRRWTEHFGTLSASAMVSQFHAGDRRERRAESAGYGWIERGERRYRVRYGRGSQESVLLQAALEHAWQDLTAVLEEADRL